MFLTPEQLVELTGRRQSAAQGRALNAMGITFRIRPTGTLAVLTAHVEAVMGGAPANDASPIAEPNWEANIAFGVKKDRVRST